MTVLAILATIFGCLMGAAALPQAHKIFKRKSAKDISILTYSVRLCGATIWILYGLEIGNVPITLANGIGLASISAVIIGWIKYK